MEPIPPFLPPVTTDMETKRTQRQVRESAARSCKACTKLYHPRPRRRPCVKKGPVRAGLADPWTQEDQDWLAQLHALIEQAKRASKDGRSVQDPVARAIWTPQPNVYTSFRSASARPPVM